VLLPAVVSLAIARVVGEYVSGLGLTARTSAATVIGFVVNIAANLILIPRFGIAGAATASLISYTTTALIITLIASRLAGAPMRAFWIPGPADVRFVVATATALGRRLRRGSPVSTDDRDQTVS
jgi:O-antigen/teichoic acid export membrane protein